MFTFEVSQFCVSLTRQGLGHGRISHGPHFKVTDRARPLLFFVPGLFFVSWQNTVFLMTDLFWCVAMRFGRKLFLDRLGLHLGIWSTESCQLSVWPKTIPAILSFLPGQRGKVTSGRGCLTLGHTGDHHYMQFQPPKQAIIKKIQAFYFTSSPRRLFHFGFLAGLFTISCPQMMPLRLERSGQNICAKEGFVIKNLFKFDSWQKHESNLTRHWPWSFAFCKPSSIRKEVARITPYVNESGKKEVTKVRGGMERF